MDANTDSETVLVDVESRVEAHWVPAPVGARGLRHEQTHWRRILPELLNTATLEMLTFFTERRGRGGHGLQVPASALLLNFTEASNAQTHKLLGINHKAH